MRNFKYKFNKNKKSNLLLILTIFTLQIVIPNVLLSNQVHIDGNMDNSLIQNKLFKELSTSAEINIFDGLYIEYESLGYPINITYYQISDDVFHVIFELMIEGTSYIGYWDVNIQTRMMENAGGDAYFDDNCHTPIWIYTNVSIGDEIPICVDGEGNHIFSVNHEVIFDISGFGELEAFALIDLTTSGGMAFYEKNSGILLIGDFIYAGGAQSYNMHIIDSNANMDHNDLNHDLKVEVEVPENIQINNDYVITAEVSNVGDFDESNINLYLYYDGTIVNSLFISDLHIGECISIDYAWTPAEYQSYNFTAYTPPVIDESLIQNNVDEELLYISEESNIFDGMFIDYTFNMLTESFPSKFTYSQISNNIFNVTWDLVLMGTPSSSHWDENTQNRIMENPVGSNHFNDSSHSPIWIFTDVSNGDLIPISVDGEGDHMFLVNGETILNIPGVGQFDVIEVLDQTLPGGMAWYEKNTGILLKGIFYFYDSVFSYNLEMVNTNAFNNVPPKWDEIPLDQVINYGDDLSYNVDASVLSGNINYVINDTANFNIDSNGLITNIIPLTVGEYWIEIYAYSDYDKNCNALIKITVLDGNEGGGNGEIPGYEISILFILAVIFIFGILVLMRNKFNVKNF